MSADIKAAIAALNDDEQAEFVLGLVERMSVVGLAGLVKKVEDRFGVKAAGAGTIVQQQGQPQQQVEVVPEKTDFTVFIQALDAAKKLAVIKEVRAITGLGLKEAKDLVDNVPKAVKSNMNKGDAENAKKLLELAGATVELR